jgi:hypothetical protein
MYLLPKPGNNANVTILPDIAPDMTSSGCVVEALLLLPLFLVVVVVAGIEMGKGPSGHSADTGRSDLEKKPEKAPGGAGRRKKYITHAYIICGTKRQPAYRIRIQRRLIVRRAAKKRVCSLLRLASFCAYAHVAPAASTCLQLCGENLRALSITDLYCAGRRENKQDIIIEVGKLRSALSVKKQLVSAPVSAMRDKWNPAHACFTTTPSAYRLAQRYVHSCLHLAVQLSSGLRSVRQKDHHAKGRAQGASKFL